MGAGAYANERVHVDMWISGHAAAVITAALKDESVRLHHEATQVSDEDESKRLRQLGHDTDRLAEWFRWAKRDPKVTPIRNSGGYSDQRGASGNSSIVQVESTKLLPLIIMMCILTGLCIGGVAWAISMAFRAQERADLLQLEVESFKNVLHANKLPTSAHLKGESP